MSQWLDLVRGATVTLPAAQLVLLLAALTACMAFGLRRTGLVVAYLFLYAWGWPFFQGQSMQFVVVYVLFGCLTCVVGVLALVRQRRRAAAPGGEAAPRER
jgi:hypothetical protein